MSSKDVFPKRNLPGEAEQWGRTIEGRQVSAEEELVQLRQMVENLQRAVSGLASVSSTFITDFQGMEDGAPRLRGRVLFVHEQSADLPDTRPDGGSTVAVGYNLSNSPSGLGILFGSDIQSTGGDTIAVGKNVSVGDGGGGIFLSDGANLDEAPSTIVIGRISSDEDSLDPTPRPIVIGNYLVREDEYGSKENPQMMSINIGHKNFNGYNSTVIGSDNDIDGGSRNVTLGLENESVYAYEQVVIGFGNTGGNQCYVVGARNTVGDFNDPHSGSYSTVIGRENNMGASYLSNVIGHQNEIADGGYTSQILGSENYILGAAGWMNIVGSDNSIEGIENYGSSNNILGGNNKLSSPILSDDTYWELGGTSYSSVIGTFNNVTSPEISTIIGPFNNVNWVGGSDPEPTEGASSTVIIGRYNNINLNTLSSREEMTTLIMGVANTISHNRVYIFGDMLRSTADDQVKFGSIHFEHRKVETVPGAPGEDEVRTYFDGTRVVSKTEDYVFQGGSPISHETVDTDLTWDGAEELDLTPNLHQIYTVTLEDDSTVELPEADEDTAFEILLDIEPDGTYTLDFTSDADVEIKGGTLTITDRTVVRLMWNRRGWFAYV